MGGRECFHKQKNKKTKAATWVAFVSDRQDSIIELVLYHVHADPARTGNEDSLQRHGATVPPDNLLHLLGRHSD